MVRALEGIIQNSSIFTQQFTYNFLECSQTPNLPGRRKKLKGEKIGKHSYARLRRDHQKEQWPPNEPSPGSKKSEKKKNKQTNQQPLKL